MVAHKLGARVDLESSKHAEFSHGTVMFQFYRIQKPLIWKLKNPKEQQWQIRVWYIKTQSNYVVSFRIMQLVQIHKKNAMNMLKY